MKTERVSLEFFHLTILLKATQISHGKPISDHEQNFWQMEQKMS